MKLKRGLFVTTNYRISVGLFKSKKRPIYEVGETFEIVNHIKPKAFHLDKWVIRHCKTDKLCLIGDVSAHAFLPIMSPLELAIYRISNGV